MLIYKYIWSYTPMIYCNYSSWFRFSFQITILLNWIVNWVFPTVKDSKHHTASNHDESTSAFYVDLEPSVVENIGNEWILSPPAWWLLLVMDYPPFHRGNGIDTGYSIPSYPACSSKIGIGYPYTNILYVWLGRVTYIKTHIRVTRIG